jgi:hypothetical protein
MPTYNYYLKKYKSERPNLTYNQIQQLASYQSKKDKCDKEQSKSKPKSKPKPKRKSKSKKN